MNHFNILQSDDTLLQSTQKFTHVTCMYIAESERKYNLIPCRVFKKKKESYTRVQVILHRLLISINISEFQSLGDVFLLYMVFTMYYDYGHGEIQLVYPSPQQITPEIPGSRTHTEINRYSACVSFYIRSCLPCFLYI